MVRFKVVCVNCGNEEIDIEPISGFGWWDDGYYLECACGNRTENSLEDERDNFTAPVYNPD